MYCERVHRYKRFLCCTCVEEIETESHRMRRNLVWFCFFVTEKPKVQPTALFILAGKVVIEWDIKTMPTWMRVRMEKEKITIRNS